MVDFNLDEMQVVCRFDKEPTALELELEALVQELLD